MGKERNMCKIKLRTLTIRLVNETLQKMNSDRRCFRLIGGVLVERTVKDVLPSIVQNQEGITSIMKQLAETYKKKEEEMMEFQKK